MFRERARIFSRIIYAGFRPGTTLRQGSGKASLFGKRTLNHVRPCAAQRRRQLELLIFNYQSHLSDEWPTTFPCHRSRRFSLGTQVGLDQSQFWWSEANPLIDYSHNGFTQTMAPHNKYLKKTQCGDWKNAEERNIFFLYRSHIKKGKRPFSKKTTGTIPCPNALFSSFFFFLLNPGFPGLSIRGVFS